MDRIIVLIAGAALTVSAVSLYVTHRELGASQEAQAAAAKQVQYLREDREARIRREISAQEMIRAREHREEIACLAVNIYFEARGEPRKGQEAVALVTLNRVRSRRFPNNVCEVVHQARLDNHGVPVLHACQFSWHCDGFEREVTEKNVYTQIHALAEFVYVNHLLNPGAMEDHTRGSTHFHARRVAPHWSRHPNYIQVIVIGEHVFYKPARR